MSWAYLGLDSLFNTVYNTVASLLQAFLARVSNIDPRYLLTAGISSPNAVSTVVENQSSTGLVAQVINYGIDKVSSLAGAIVSVPTGIYNYLSGNAASEGVRLLGEGNYPLVTISQNPISTTEAMLQVAKNHPYLLTGCALAVGGVLLYNYSGSDKEGLSIREEAATSSAKPWSRIRRSEAASLMDEAQRFIDSPTAKH